MRLLTLLFLMPLTLTLPGCRSEKESATATPASQTPATEGDSTSAESRTATSRSADREPAETPVVPEPPPSPSPEPETAATPEPPPAPTPLQGEGATTSSAASPPTTTSAEAASAAHKESAQRAAAPVRSILESLPKQGAGEVRAEELTAARQRVEQLPTQLEQTLSPTDSRLPIAREATEQILEKIDEAAPATPAEREAQMQELRSRLSQLEQTLTEKSGQP